MPVLVLVLVLAPLWAACSSKPGAPSPAVGSGSGSGSATPPVAAVGVGSDGLPTLPPARPLPPAPDSLPAPVGAPATAELVALGEALFFEPRLAGDDRTACASCHDPDHDFAGAGPAPNAAGELNLRNAPALTNLAWQRELGWDGRFPAAKNLLLQHWRGQLKLDPSTAVQKLAAVPLYRAHFLRAAQREPDGAVAIDALVAFVSSRFSGDSAWDKVERGAAPEDPALRAGYALFTGKAQCAACHPPPLYSDFAYHRLGLIQTGDEGRGKVDPDAMGAFKTPSLRGAALRRAYFHDGSATTLELAVDWHLAGGVGQGAAPTIIDPALQPVVLTPEEREQLLGFVRALTPTAAPYPRPAPVP